MSTWPATDTHAHLYWEDFAEPVPDLLERARLAGVETIIVPGTNLETSLKVRDLVGEHAGVYGAAGIHPTDVAEIDEETLSENLRHLLDHPSMVAVGEIGLDYYWDITYKEKQKRLLHQQIQLALELNKPVILHNRQSDEDLLDIIRDYRGSGLRGIFHCFSGNEAVLREALANPGFYISFAGNVTYKNSTLRHLLPLIPINRLLTETDAPFLAPVPYRGKRNEPAMITATIEHMASVLDLTPGDINRNVGTSVHSLFGIGTGPKPAIAFTIGKRLYINLTNRCTANCIFCDRSSDTILHGYETRLDHEPSVSEVLAALPDLTGLSEVVFAGPGEPFIRLHDLMTLARLFREQGLPVRVVTNGHGFLLHDRNFLDDLTGLVDRLSVILPTLTPSDYQVLMRLKEEGVSFTGLLDFARQARHVIPEVEFVHRLDPLDRTGMELKVLEGIPIRLTSLYHLV
ncbi:MAG: YchF/TatD family DNA exonuclease [Bacteroidetes bacterium]|nr:YchF/TatD family DNA exonuclease [Bacteroidota bacterium]